MPLKQYPDHEFMPRELTPEEIAEPTLVIDRFFDYMHLPMHRKVLRELLEALVTGRFVRLSGEERDDLLHQYQWLEKIVEAIHVIHNNSSVKSKST
jgi:hypothetical protein